MLGVAMRCRTEQVRVVVEIQLPRLGLRYGE
jgi:hypothetical protein